MSNTSMTRRDFNSAAATVAVALTIVGCDNQSTEAADRKEAPKLPAEPFAAGKIADYSKAGVYDTHKDKNVWLISDGKKLIAVSGLCTHKGCAVNKAENTYALACPCHKAKFDNDGVPAAGAKAERPLERLKITAAKDVITVDPTKLFKEQADWDKADAFLKLA